MSFSVYFLNKLPKNYQTLIDGSRARIVPRGEERGLFWRRTQLLSSGHKAKGCSTRFWAYFMGPPEATFEIWKGILAIPSHGRRGAT